MKKNVLSFLTGPPSVPPNWLRRDLHAVLVVEPVIRVQGRILQEFVGAAMKIVRTGLGYDVNYGVSAEADIGAVRVLLDFEFLHGVYRRRIQRGGDPAVVFLVGLA